MTAFTNLSLLFTLYTRSGDKGQTTNVSFPLRNLPGELSAQVEQATQIMEEVATELHYLTGYGVDKGRVRQGSSTLAQQLYPELTPCAAEWEFHRALLWSFPDTLAYCWVRDGQTRSVPPSDEQGWELGARPIRRATSFRLPVVLRNAGDRLREDCQPFFRSDGRLYRRRARNSYGVRVSYDRADVILQRFVSRFYENGQLGIGRRGEFIPNEGRYHVEGRWWPQSTAKPKKQPKRAPRITSHPTDGTEWIYVIQVGRQAIYKLGISNDPVGRLAMLQTANPHKLRLLHQFRADNATAAEYSLHTLLQSQRLQGEWFRLSAKQRDRILKILEYRNQEFHMEEQAFKAEALFNDD